MLGEFISYMGEMITLIDWASPWVWLAVVVLGALFYKAN